MSETIKELITLAQAGDEASREALWEEFKPLRYKWAASIILPGLEWEDLQQEAYIILMKAISKYDATLGMTFEGYYKVNLYNWRYKRFRRKREYLGIGEDIADQENYQMPIYTEDIADQIYTQISYDRLAELLKELEEMDRELIVRHYFRYELIKDIAHDIGIKEHTAYTRVSRCLKKLKGKMS